MIGIYISPSSFRSCFQCFVWCPSFLTRVTCVVWKSIFTHIVCLKLFLYSCRINKLSDTYVCIHLLSHTNKCTNCIICYLKSVLIIDIKTLSYFHSSYMFRHITRHPQGALMFLAKITGKTICKTWTYVVWRVWQHAATPFTQYMFMFYKLFYQWFWLGTW
jgi:hypothetical protein